LQVQRGQGREGSVVGLRHGGDARIGGRGARGALAQAQRQPGKQRAVRLDVVGAQARVRLARGGIHALAHGLDRIAVDVAVVDETGRGADQQRDLARAAHAQAVAFDVHLAVAQGHDAHGVAQDALHAGVVGVTAFDEQGARAVRADGQARRTLGFQQVFPDVPGGARGDVVSGLRHVERAVAVPGLARVAVADVEVERAARRLQAQHDHLVGRAGEHLAHVARGAAAKARRRDRAVEVQRAPEALRAIDAVEVEQQVAGRAVGHLRGRLRDHLFRHEVARLDELALVDQRPHARQRGLEAGIVEAVRTAGPQRVLVELQAFLQRAAIHHGAQAAIADGEGFDPFARGFVVPQRELVLVADLARHDRGTGQAGHAARGGRKAQCAEHAAPGRVDLLMTCFAQCRLLVFVDCCLL